MKQWIIEIYQNMVKDIPKTRNVKQGLYARKEVPTEKLQEKLGLVQARFFYGHKGINLTLEQKNAIQERRYKPTFTKERREKLRQLARKNLSSYWKPAPTREELLQRIVDFYKKRGRIPLKREFNNAYKEYRKKFGSWNNAIQLAGFEPNSVIFSKKFIAKDGHICDSFAEKILDDWLSGNKIKHKRNFFYLNQKMTADFAIGNIRIEYFGLAGEIKGYDDIIQRKQKICRKENLKLIEIYPRDLFSRDFKSCLGKILKEIRR